jgi:hypothetical protein
MKPQSIGGGGALHGRRDKHVANVGFFSGRHIPAFHRRGPICRVGVGYLRICESKTKNNRITRT